MTTQLMQDDPTSLILPRVRALTAYQLDPHPASVKLDQNENTLGPPEPIRAELEERVRKVPLFRYPTPGQPEIRAALATAFDGRADRSLVGNESDEPLNTPALALQPQRKIILPRFALRSAHNDLRLAAEQIPLQVGPVKDRLQLLPPPPWSNRSGQENAEVV